MPPKEKRLAIILAISLVGIVIPIFLLSYRERVQNFFIAFLDVGQGDAALIHFGKGAQMLVDCGPTRKVLAGLGRRMPFYDRTIEYLVVTHPDRDHYVGCIDVLDRYTVKHIWWNGYDTNKDPVWKVWKEKMAAEGAEIHVIDKEEELAFGDAVLRVFYPDHSVVNDPQVPGFDGSVSDNNASIVMRIVHGRMSFLLTADAEKELEAYLAQKYGDALRSDVLHVGHHGSNTSSIQEFLDAAHPSIGIISSGKGNRYGHPAPRVLKRLERARAAIRRTDTEGDVVLW